MTQSAFFEGVYTNVPTLAVADCGLVQRENEDIEHENKSPELHAEKTYHLHYVDPPPPS